MGGLFAALNTASSALGAFSQALGVDESNVANASTPGYAAQRASISSIDLSGNGPGGGASTDIVTTTSSGSPFADAAVGAASSDASYSQTQATQLTPVNQLFDITGQSGILAALEQFSSAFSSLAADPNNTTDGQAALTAAGNVASAFQSVAASLGTQRAQVDLQIQSATGEINNLASQIRQLNVQIRGQSGTTAAPDAGAQATLRNDLDQLSALIDVNVTTNADGTVNVLAGGELPVVLGDQAYTLSADPSAAAGSQISSSGGGSSPDAFSGQLGALFGVRNGTLDALLGSAGNSGTLNTLAEGFAGDVNQLLSSGLTTSGGAGVPIFTWDPANAAATLAVDAMVTPAQLGIGTSGANGSSNGVANELAGLASSTAAANQINGQSANDYFAAIAASVGQQLSDANTAATNSQNALTAAQNNRQQIEGVSLDQEAANITQFQNSYQANAQVVSILDQLTEDTINIIAPTTG